MAASTSSFSISSTPPSDSEIWGSTSGPRSASPSPDVAELRDADTSLRRRNGGGNTPRLTSSVSTPISLNQASRHDSASVYPSNSGTGSSSTPLLKPSATPSPHPLAQVGPTPPTHHVDVLGDVSRPSLHRLTSETERQVAESSRSGSEYTGSMRGSLDLLRMSAVDEQQASGGEVEVLIHTIKANQSLAGIALLYGIDLATLRKVNKLWTSDPIHLRTHLYVPLEACKWNKASEVLIRGPGEGQVTLYPKIKGRAAGLPDSRSGSDKGKGKEVNHEQSMSNGYHRSSPNMIDRGPSNSATVISSDEDHPWFANTSNSTSHDNSLRMAAEFNSDPLHPPISPQASSSHQHPDPHNRSRSTSAAAQFLPSTNIAYDTSLHLHSQIPPDLLDSSLSTSETSSTAISESSLEPTPRVLDVVRIPSSQLRFFPKRKPPDNQSQCQSPVDVSGRTHSRTSSFMNHGRRGAGTTVEDEHQNPLFTRAAEAIRRNSDAENTFASTFGDGPSIVNDLSTLPRPLRGHEDAYEGTGPGSPPRATVKPRAKTTVVRLRPPQSNSAPTSSSNTFANRLSSLFTVPPPPPLPPPSAPHARSRMASSTSSPAIGIGMGTPGTIARNGRSTPRSGSAANSRATSRSSTPTLKGREESMELVPRLNDLRVGMGSFGVHFGKGGLGITFPSAPAHTATGNETSRPYRSPDISFVSTYGASKGGSQNGLKKKDSFKRKED
ncbi:hypothetical protein I316_00294 [Kwoniella heveanensis BCC8398]|uniref:LysM domain-containing protein n=1 Tax=Kwoniella heveanensis BCC8398 TaxID=1296120 RepID=A0A1B9H479_9TREE|nr:hypothetical protein I316_00294 [Kwoniella heveanensis BCC8398]